MKLAARPLASMLSAMAGIWITTAVPAHAATIMWTNTQGGNWGVAINWMPHQVPGPGDVARITLTTASRVEVNLDVDATVAGLNMTGSAHRLRLNGNTLSVNGPITLGDNQEIYVNGGSFAGSDSTSVSGGTIVWSAGGMTGPLSLGTGTTLQLRGVNGVPYDLFAALTNAGTLQIISGNLRLRSGQIYNLAGSLLDFQSDSDLSSYSAGNELLSNQGTVRKSGGSGLSTCDVPCLNQGAIDAVSGTLDWSAGGTLDPGTTFTGTGTNQFSGGTFIISATVDIPNARLAGATLAGADGTLGGSWIWTSGYLGQPGTSLTLAPNAVLALKGVNGSPYDLQGTSTNAGTIRIVTGNLRFRDSQLYNLAGGLVDFMSDSDLSSYSAGGELLSNAGTIRKSGGSGLSTVDVALQNQGSIDTLFGTLDWSNGGTFDPGSTFTGTGTNQLSGGTFVVNTVVNTPNARLAGATLIGAGGTLSGSWIWTSGAVGQSDGSLTLAPSGFLALKGVNGSPYDLQGVLSNAGAIKILTGNLRLRGGQVYNLPNALLDFQSDSDISTYSAGGELLSNSGTVRKSVGSGASTIDVECQNQGTIDAQSGTLDWANGGGLEPGSSFTGTGTNQFSGGTLLVNTTVRIPNARLAGARLAGANGTLGGSWIWTSGTVGQPDGTLTLEAAGVLALKGVNGSPYDTEGALRNFGTIQIVAGNLRCRGAQVYNLPGGLIDFQSDSDLTTYSLDTELLSNLGTVRKSGGSGLSTVDVRVLHLGATDVQTGTLDWSGGGNIYSGSTFTGMGTNQFSGGTFAISTTLNIPNARIAGATFLGANAVLTGSWIWTSGVLGQPDSAFTLASDGLLVLKGTSGSPYDLGGVFTNLGTIQLVRGNLRCREAQLYNQPSGLVDFQSDSGIDSYSTGSELVSNRGTMRKSGGTGTSSVEPAMSNRGTLDAQVGIVSLDGQRDLAGGRINCGINGLGSNGQVRFSGNATLLGTFSANLNNGYQPNTNDMFTVVTYGSRIGTFSPLALPAGYTWETNYTATAFMLKVAGSSSMPQLRVIIDLVSGLPHLSWDSTPGDRFQTQYQDNVTQGTWVDLGPILIATSGKTEITDSSAQSVSRRFYRVNQSP